MHDTHTIWNTALESIKDSVSDANFNTWFKNTHIEKNDNGTVYVGVPNEFVKEWLYTKYHKMILKSLRDIHEHIRCVEYVISKKKPPVPPSSQPQSSVLAPFQQPSSQPSDTLPLDNLFVHRKSGLNPRYTFDSFVIGPFNELAYSASQAILQKPGVYNPLFIYGETGLGKTHLIQAIGNTLQNGHHSKEVFYTSSEKFTSDLVGALKNHRMDAFRAKYRKYDVLIMDDIQFLSGRDKTQEELFHLFNILFDYNKQIIFSSDKHPNYIIGLENRLKSRFSQGMIVDINRPEYESRVAIIRKHASDILHKLSDDVIDYIAEHVEGNIREIIGILNSLTCQIQLKDDYPLGLSDVKHFIKDNVKPKRQVSIDDVVSIISHFYNIEKELLYDKTRRKEIVKSRQIAMYILREDYNISLPVIGKGMGGRDHTTVIHSCDKIKKHLEEDTSLAQEIEQIRAMLLAR